ncbi:ExeM/NucH family extracellular endonuclease [Corynebacterium maris]|nr:ExeM/NucH family extracellular endonuclease [Corynebacterium maris]
MSRSLRPRSMRAAAISVALGAASALLVVPAAVAAPDGSDVVISEVYSAGGNGGSVFANDFVELYNPTDDVIDLADHTLTRYSASGNPQNDVVTLTGAIPAGGHYLVQTAAGNNDTGALPTPDFDAGDDLGFGARTAAAELKDDAGTTIDLLGWGAIDVAEGAAAASPNADQSVQRIPVEVDTDDNAADFIVDAPTPTNSADESATGGDAGGGDDVPASEPGEVTPIAEIQGTGDATPLNGQTVTTEGVVTGVYPDGGKNGFYLQTAGTGGDAQNVGDASHGVFVHLGHRGAEAYPEIGESVVVTGTAGEYYDVTQLSGAAVTPADAELDPVTPITIDVLPAGDDAREPYEGMLVQPTGDYTVTDNYALNTHGELGLTPGTEAFSTPTDVVLPGTAANDLQASNDARLVTLDDGRTPNYMHDATDVPLPYLAVDGAPHQSIRTGDHVDFQHPVVVDYGFDSWRFQPTTPITGDNSAAELPITWADSRAEALAEIDAVDGEFTVGSFNVLNYFTSLGVDEPGCDYYTDVDGNPVGANWCDVRGAYSEEAFADQQAKIVQAINMMDVDVLGLEEIENTYGLTGDVDARDDALAALVDALNADAGQQRWAYVESPADLGTDEDVIRVAFIYNPATVETVGESRIFDGDAYTGTARQPLAQEFQPVEGGDSFVAVTNHFKSKGSVSRGDSDQNDGQGNNPNVRNAQSQALLDHLDAQEDWVDAPVFVLGDLNAYAREDAIRTLEANGFTNINTEYAGHEPTYQFDGQLGSLDHAFGNEAAMELVQDAVVWNINADESIAYEYSRRNYNTVDFFEADNPFRSSDHDPIKVGFNLTVDAPTPPVEDEDETPAPAPTGSSLMSSVAAIFASIGAALERFFSFFR